MGLHVLAVAQNCEMADPPPPPLPPCGLIIRIYWWQARLAFASTGEFGQPVMIGGKRCLQCEWRKF